jgi:hypothetical protein
VGGEACVSGWEDCASTRTENAASATPPSRIAGAQSRIARGFIIVVCALPDADRNQGRQEPGLVLRLFLKTTAWASVLYRDFGLQNHSSEDNWGHNSIFFAFPRRPVSLRALHEGWCSRFSAKWKGLFQK